jgi:hypothetical protein
MYSLCVQTKHARKALIPLIGAFPGKSISIYMPCQPLDFLLQCKQVRQQIVGRCKNGPDSMNWRVNNCPLLTNVWGLKKLKATQTRHGNFQNTAPHVFLIRVLGTICQKYTNPFQIRVWTLASIELNKKPSKHSDIPP